MSEQPTELSQPSIKQAGAGRGKLPPKLPSLPPYQSVKGERERKAGDGGEHYSGGGVSHSHSVIENRQGKARQAGLSGAWADESEPASGDKRQEREGGTSGGGPVDIWKVCRRR